MSESLQSTQAPTLVMQGRGMFYGESDQWGHKRVFTVPQWDAICRQAQSWGMQWLHPKVADGGYWWYDPNPANTTGTSLAMLTATAHHYGLKVAPYHYCYGNKFGALSNEATMAAMIAKICDACCPDIEIEWQGQHQWALDFGRIARQVAPHGLFYPTLFADPAYFPQFPYLELERWMDGWLPMVYFSVWRDQYGRQDSAVEALDFVFPMWLALDQRTKAAGIVPKPILPLVEVGSALPPSEIANWLHIAGGYGYCGFWYDGLYGPYVEAVKSQPVPQIPGGNPPPPPPHVPVIETPYVANALKGPGLTDEPGDPNMNQNLTPSQLAALWHMAGTTMAFNTALGLPRLWATLVQKHPDWGVGAPIGNSETPFAIGNVKGTYIDCIGGRQLIAYSDGTLAVGMTPTSKSDTPAKTASMGLVSSMPTVMVPAVTPVTSPTLAALAHGETPIPSPEPTQEQAPAAELVS